MARGQRSCCSRRAPRCPGAVHVRDSKNADGPTFAVGSQAWGAFVMYGAGA
ncbi:DUF397 domain-containing protein [Streptomyces coelicoflavus]|uniref:DUF397 domain-containing protein n=1 Tax=Streptomyces coelicoflavus TaxID=285562 RepID=UPI00381FFF2D